MIAQHVIDLHDIHVVDISRIKNLLRRLRTRETGRGRNLTPFVKSTLHPHLGPKAQQDRNANQ